MVTTTTQEKVCSEFFCYVCLLFFLCLLYFVAISLVFTAHLNKKNEHTALVGDACANPFLSNFPMNNN